MIGPSIRFSIDIKGTSVRDTGKKRFLTSYRSKLYGYLKDGFVRCEIIKNDFEDIRFYTINSDKTGWGWPVLPSGEVITLFENEINKIIKQITDRDRRLRKEAIDLHGKSISFSKGCLRETAPNGTVAVIGGGECSYVIFLGVSNGEWYTIYGMKTVCYWGGIIYSVKMDKEETMKYYNSCPINHVKSIGKKNITNEMFGSS